MLSDRIPTPSSNLDPNVDLDLDDSMNEGGAFDPQAELELYWAYISGLLRNMTTLPAERILSMLSWVSEQPLTLDHVRTFLNEKVKAGQLSVQGVQYSLVKR